MNELFFTKLLKEEFDSKQNNNMSKNLIKKTIIESIKQKYTIVDEKQFKSALSDLATSLPSRVS